MSLNPSPYETGHVIHMRKNTSVHLLTIKKSRHTGADLDDEVLKVGSLKSQSS